MKVLMLTPYVTINDRAEFSKNKTGFGYMVYDIAHAVAKTEHVDVLATDSLGGKFVIEGVRYLRRSLPLLLLHLIRSCNPCIIIKLIKQYRVNRSTGIRLWYYWVMSGYIDWILEKERYDVVHIHGCTFANEIWMSIFQKRKIRYVVTLHGLNSFSDTVRLSAGGKQYERDFLKRVVAGEFPITVISTGMKRIIEKTYGVSDCSNITIVCNSFNFSDINYGCRAKKINIKQLYNIPENSKIILYVGNVCLRKNQGQLIKAFELLKEDTAKNTYVLFLGGNYEPGYTIETLAHGGKYASHFISCGVVDKEKVHYYYEQGDAVALMSLSEGFGLSLIEGLYFGIPCMSFTDVDAFDDIYNPQVMVGVEDHSDVSVAQGIEALLGRDWDKEQIKQYSKKFESQQMANNYVKVYQKIV